MKGVDGYSLVFSMGDFIQRHDDAKRFKLELGLKECYFGCYCEIIDIFISDKTKTVFVATIEIEEYECEDDVSI